MMHKTVGVFVSLMLACSFVHADDPPAQQEAVPQAKKSDDEKKKDQKENDKKPKVPAGYEDAAEARAVRPLRRAAVAIDEANAAVLEGDVKKIVAARVDANVANRERQFLPQFEPLMTAELSFLNRACDLNLEQRKTIKAASDHCLKAAVRIYAMSQNGRAVGFQGRRVESIPDPSELIHQTLAKVLEETLRPEQRSAYDDEIVKRNAHRQRAAAEVVVAMIDKQLFLTEEQRQQLTQSLDKNWQASWIQPLEMLLNVGDQLPNIPDQFVLPALNSSQQQVWRTAPKATLRTWGGFEWGNQLGAVDDFPLVETMAEVE